MTMTRFIYLFFLRFLFIWIVRMARHSARKRQAFGGQDYDAQAERHGWTA